MQPNARTQSRQDSDKHHRDEPPLNALEVLRSAATAEGMPIEWIFDRANLSRDNTAGSFLS
jgi:hypothetical protein